MDNTITPPVSLRVPDDKTVVDWAQREALPLQQAIRKKLNQRYFDSFDYTTTNTAAFETAWTSSAMPTGSTWEVDILVIAQATDGSSARYHFEGLFKRASGNASQVGSTYVIAPIEDVAAWDADFSFSGQTVLVQVKGDVSRVVNWSVMPLIREKVL